jgi:sugar lactone lactonase YvrE
MANNKDFLLKNAVEVGGSTKVTLGTITSSDIDLSTGNYFSDTLAANTTYTISNAGDVQSFQLEVTGGAVGYDLGAAVYDSVSFSVASQELTPTGVAFNTDGTKMFICGSAGDEVNEYALSTAWDVSTASYTTVFSVSAQDTAPEDITFKPDGTKMYMVGRTGDAVYQYSLSTAYGISTASYDSVSLSVSSQDIFPTGLRFSSDGTKLFVLGDTNDTIYQYDLTTAWDLSTASYASKSFSVASQDSAPSSLAFNDSGTKLFVLGRSTRDAFQYTLSTAWDISTASYDSITFVLENQPGDPAGMAFSADGTKMYVVDYNADLVYQYSTAVATTLTWPTSIEWGGGVSPAAPAAGETDVFTITTDDGGTTYTGVKTADNLS